ncbi:hypothetical protein C8R45DRAFT_387744 [Mycena sanguinolenta]|nr:hypothetical protein C8R45DRAFT_387744 [Mycena sanguinolenta]
MVNQAQVPQPQQLICADAELHSLLMSLYTHRPCVFEFDPSTVKDYVPNATPETHYSVAALRRHDQQYAVKHFRPSPSTTFPFAKYPPNENGHVGGMTPLPVKQSFESAIFGCPNNAPPPTILYCPPPNPWKAPLVDAPPSICPQRTLKSSTYVDLAQSSKRPATTKSLSRPTISLPPRAQQQALHNLGSLPASSTQAPSSSDYSEAAGNGNNKRKAVNPPSHRPPKKSLLAPMPPPPPPSRAPKPAPLKCGIDACPETFRTKQMLQQHQQRHLCSRQRISCSGCPAAFGRMEDLQTHLTHSAVCVTQNAAKLLQLFYLQPEVIALNPAAAPQNELMGYWRRFVVAVQRKYNA